MYVCIWTSMYAWYTCMHVCTYVGEVCMQVGVHRQAARRTGRQVASAYSSMRACMHVCMQISLCVCMHMYIYIHNYTHTKSGTRSHGRATLEPHIPKLNTISSFGFMCRFIKHQARNLQPLNNKCRISPEGHQHANCIVQVKVWGLMQGP